MQDFFGYVFFLSVVRGSWQPPTRLISSQSFYFFSGFLLAYLSIVIERILRGKTKALLSGSHCMQDPQLWGTLKLSLLCFLGKLTSLHLQIINLFRKTWNQTTETETLNLPCLLIFLLAKSSLRIETFKKIKASKISFWQNQRSWCWEVYCTCLCQIGFSSTYLPSTVGSQNSKIIEISVVYGVCFQGYVYTGISLLVWQKVMAITMWTPQILRMLLEAHSCGSKYLTLGIFLFPTFFHLHDPSYLFLPQGDKTYLQRLYQNCSNYKFWVSIIMVSIMVRITKRWRIWNFFPQQDNELEDRQIKILVYGEIMRANRDWDSKPFIFCRIYGPLVLPYLVGMIVLGVEVIGDVTATAEVSHIETAGPKHRRRIKGALLADGFNCFLAACAMTLPVTTFAQNNGVSPF